jgi:hypothetical protein
MMAGMRVLGLIIVFGVPAAFAQPAPDAFGCNVISQSTDINEAGEFVRPPPTPDQCLFAADLITQLLRTDARKVRRVTRATAIPYPVRIRIGSGLDDQDTVTWTTGNLVIVAYRTRDFTGTGTSVEIADLESGTVCHYPRWPTSKTPRQLSLREIQEVLEGGLTGDEPVPTCYLRELDAPED